MAIIFVPAVLVAYVLARYSFPGKVLVSTLTSFYQTDSGNQTLQSMLKNMGIPVRKVEMNAGNRHRAVQGRGLSRLSPKGIVLDYGVRHRAGKSNYLQCRTNKADTLRALCLQHLHHLWQLDCNSQRIVN